MNYDYLHETEEIVLKPAQPQSSRTLWTLLEEQGFTLFEDLFAFNRPKRDVLPWQSDEIASVDIYLQDEPVYDPKGHWDKLVLQYLLATQPRSGISVFVERTSQIAEKLGLTMTYRGKAITTRELEECLNSAADELSSAVGEPGGEYMAILIESTYPRTAINRM